MSIEDRIIPKTKKEMYLIRMARLRMTQILKTLIKLVEIVYEETPK